MPPEVEHEILAFQAVERQKRPLRPDERKKYFPVEQGASGAPASVLQEVEMTDEELLAEAKPRSSKRWLAGYSRTPPSK